LQSIENITREREPAPKTNEAVFSQAHHFAIKQSGVNLDFFIEQFYRNEQVSFHFFSDFEDLVTICQRFPISAIVIGGRKEFLAEIELVQGIKANTFLSLIPVILYHPEPSKNIVIAAYENGAEDFIQGDWMDRQVEVRVRSVIESNRRDLSINPSTFLPGPSSIEHEVQRQIDMGAEFAACYADLDNFKAFNDYYGYAYGDKVIRLTARIIKDIVFDTCREGFVGHIAGDDFIFVVQRDLVEPICSWIIKTFDAIIPYRYQLEDRLRGYVSTVNRRGEIEDYPLLSISIAVVVNHNRMFGHAAELSQMLADLKKATKQLPGSNYMVERRKKY
jgi:diguanylate cyclase (GGDEF)-like protein